MRPPCSQGAGLEAGDPFYFFTGGLGAPPRPSPGARAAGYEQLARRTLLVSVDADPVSPVLLTFDLGRPQRFLNMLRVFKVTSPMSVCPWTLTASGMVSGVAYKQGDAGTLAKVAKGLPTAGALMVGLGGRRRDPKYTVEPQRRRLEEARP